MVIRARQTLGKYRIRRRIGRGGFADVFEALDTIEGISVALKVPAARYVDPETLEDFRKEVRLTARLEHPNVLSIKNAEFIGEHFVIAYPLGMETLGDRLTKRLSLRRKLDYAEQLLRALAHAHSRHIVHCDVKPENLILFSGERLRLTDFGIAKVALKTVQASGTGSVGYMAPEQAMGRPSVRSDVFSTGLIIWRMLTGTLPQWPLKWPLPGHDRLRRYPEELTKFLRKSLEVEPRKRFKDAEDMLQAFLRLKPKVLASAARKKR